MKGHNIVPCIEFYITVVSLEVQLDMEKLRDWDVARLRAAQDNFATDGVKRGAVTACQVRIVEGRL